MTTLSDLHYFLPRGKFEMLAMVESTVALATPWWLPSLKEFSDVATYLLPAAGLTWLIVQIVTKILVTRKILRTGAKSE